MTEKCQLLEKQLTTLENRINPVIPIQSIKYCMRDVYGAEKPDFDDSDWKVANESIYGTRDLDKLWVRYHVVIPDEVAGIPLLGSESWVTEMFQTAMIIYVDGVEVMNEKRWAELRAPELFLPKDTVSGTKHLIAFRMDLAKSNWHGSLFRARVINKRLDDIRFEITSMIAELQYASTLKGSEEVLDAAAEWLLPQLQEFIDGTKSMIELPAILDEARSRCEAIRTEAKKRQMHLIGHAHIDMNWLWEMEETRDVIYRDFKTVCNIADDYPSFRFSQSQCAAYQIAEEYYPELFERLKEKVAAGNWDITASAWVEHDGNMPSGESMARHILYSQQYLKKHFNVKPKIMWAPDTFGHSANIPMLLQKSGIKRYFMSRCGKDDFEDMKGVNEASRPGRCSDTPIFRWEGLDGSDVLSANLPYGSDFAPQSVVGNMLAAEQAGLTTAMIIYGVGDHGGGPTRRDIKRALKADKSPLYPQILLSSTDAYYSAVEAEEPTDLRRVGGELNFVFEGCYTTHADIKFRNRKLESVLRKAEVLSWMAGQKGYVYPFDRLKDGWLCVLFNQFHDIFDGCAIAETYRYADNELDQKIAAAEQIIEEATAFLASDSKDTVTVINPTLHPAKKVVLIPDKQEYAITDQDGQLLETQTSIKGLYLWVELPPLAVRCYNLIPKAEEKKGALITETNGAYLVENEYYALTVKKNSGQIITYFDKKAKRFLVREKAHCVRSARGRLNTFVLVTEASTSMSAWSIGDTIATQYLTEQASTEIKENGRLTATLSFKHQFRASEIRQKIVFSANSPVIEFQTDVTWREVGSNRYGTPVLKVEFAPETDNECVYHEIPFGVIRRSAKDGEYPHIRFAAVQDELGGMALLNNGKYGIHSCGNQMELTLIRSGWEPDLLSDIGEHSFTYAMYPFCGELRQSAVLSVAETLHVPPTVLVDKKPEAESDINFTLPSQIAASCIKIAEANNGTILRLYENFGDEITITLPVPASVTAVCEVETGEDTVIAQQEIQNGAVQVRFKPYEMKTLFFKTN